MNLAYKRAWEPIFLGLFIGWTTVNILQNRSIYWYIPSILFLSLSIWAYMSKKPKVKKK